MKILLFFQNTHAVIKAEKAINSKGIEYQIMPVPTNISAECGMCIEINSADYPIAQECLEQEAITFQQILLK
ncbi:MAG: DUF3343 domain-containing protein [Bacteroidales bacterium]|jgi:uncharacterized protein YqgV (UPF0045/DUF77 family)|nr:DUF3343 domain-containing protein [Bacteroidales bacterium]MDD4383651.1 DUF3343 domain-containing protein [Bacteroidales bacterium]MDY0197267.1 DUF3343 domain-containing protein [Tenuifilaceae bacterium]